MTEAEKKIKEWQYIVDSEKQLSDDRVLAMMNKIAGLNVKDIGNLVEEVAYLFCNTLRKAKIETKEELISNAVKAAFENIEKMDTESQYRDCADIRVVHFLRKVFINNLAANPSDDMILHDDFQMLAENLERIHVIFKLRTQEGILFQIGTLLKSVISRWKTNQAGLTAENIYIILLAVQVFKFIQDVAAEAELEQIIHECNLKFLRYMQSDRKEFLGAEHWKVNYQYNNVLVIADTKSHKILIRSEDKAYLESNFECELNVHKQEIAYFKEIDYPESAVFRDAKFILEHGNAAQLRRLLELMMQGYVNIFQENSLLVCDNNIEVVNPYAKRDKHLVSKTEHFWIRQGFQDLDKWLEPYRLRRIAGDSIDCLTLGAVVSLLKREMVSYEKLITEDVLQGHNIQNRVFLNWLRAVERPQSGWYQLKEMFLEELRYANIQSEYKQTNFEGLRFYPIRMELSAIRQLLFDNIFGKDGMSGELLRGQIIIDFTKGEQVKIHQAERDFVLDKRDIQWLDEDSKDRIYQEGESVGIWCDIIGTYHGGTDITRITETLEEAEKGNARLIPGDFLECIAEDDIQKILDRMCLQSDGLSEDRSCRCDRDSLGRFRIASQLCYFQIVTEDRFAKYLNLIKRHRKVDFNYLNRERGHFFKDGVLYVPKEKRECLGTLTYINENILKSNAGREEERLYYTKLGRDEEGYFTFRGIRIRKIVLLFDTLQSGTATKRSLSAYFEHSNDTEWIDERGKKCQNDSQHYTVKIESGQEVRITLEDIIKTNGLTGSDIQVRCFYGTSNGKQYVKDYCEEKGTGHECLNSAVVEYDSGNEIPESSRVTDEDREVIAALFGGSVSIGKGSYMIARQFNAAKQNIFPEEALNPGSIISIFLQKKELL